MALEAGSGPLSLTIVSALPARVNGVELETFARAVIDDRQGAEAPPEELNPRFLHRSISGMRCSCSGRMSIICSPVNRDRFILSVPLKGSFEFCGGLSGGARHILSSIMAVAMT